MGKVFGGYTDIPWQDNGGCKNGNGNSFVFSLRDDFNFVKLKCLKKSDEVFHDSNFLTVIGDWASGFSIRYDCNINTHSNSNLGIKELFELPQDIEADSNEA